MPHPASASSPVVTSLAAALTRDVPAGLPIGVALSGGRDSVALLAALRTAASPRGHALHAFHVDHGLSPHAGAWRTFCADLAIRWQVPFASRAVVVARPPGTSLEAEARRARYAALSALAAQAGVQYVALAHHRDDQAETVLLQLLRGAGTRGLAGMSAVRHDARGVTWWRPLLEIDRADIDGFMHAHALAHVEDESNAQVRHRRNAVRHVALPALHAVSPHASAAIARAAQHQAEATLLADDLARIDGLDALEDATLDRAALTLLPPHRARNLLRYFLRARGLAAPSTARLAQMLAQLVDAPADARVAIGHDGLVLGLHLGKVHVHPADPAPFQAPWNGEAEIELAHGTLRFVGCGTGGLDAQRLPLPLTVRSREGGERFRLAPNRPRRALKAILREAGWPPWQRRSVPLIVTGATVVAVPGLGVEPHFRAADGMPGLTPVWRPREHSPHPLPED